MSFWCRRLTRRLGPGMGQTTFTAFAARPPADVLRVGDVLCLDELTW